VSVVKQRPDCLSARASIVCIQYINWTKGKLMASEVVHTSSVRVFGGRDGHTKSDDGNLDIRLRRPASRKPGDQGTDPEQLFAAGYAACFSGAIGAVARREKLTLGDVIIDGRVSLVRSDDGVHDIAVELDVITVGDFTQEQLEHIVREADKTCPYSRATRGNISVRLLAAGNHVQG
jgi:Ohr subfamily peroxiredoxin